jgi:hypothetical protein
MRILRGLHSRLHEPKVLGKVREEEQSTSDWPEDESECEDKGSYED